MKIVAFLNAYTKGISGGDMRFIEMAHRWDEDITVVTPAQGEQLCRECGLNALFLHTTKADQDRSVMLSYLWRTAMAVANRRWYRDADLLYSTSDFLPDVLPSFIFRHQGHRPWVQIFHHFIPPPKERSGGWLTGMGSYLMQRISLMLIRSRADLVVAVSPLMRDKLIQEGVPSKKIACIPNGVDLRLMQSISPSPERYDAVFLGRLHPSKGVLDLVEVWKQVVEHRKGSRLVIIGQGEAEEELAALIAREGLEGSVTMLGYLPREKAIALIKSSSIFLFPSHEEGFGIAILEAMACGKPVVSWDLPVYREIFRKGLLSAPMGDRKTMADLVLGLLEDQDRRKMIGREAEALASGYDWDILAKRELSLLREPHA